MPEHRTLVYIEFGEKHVLARPTAMLRSHALGLAGALVT